ncbi:hypothetical protein FA15DRAFT_662321 [Coprinopsis marcescibilis]|uniref:Uncharacterized protein n=1 Tax=Coprinopsis marcescibilis TaxID=230819 RepID=A0A5C3LBY5_COPMA|nr:hypothetical protein FA15DRAFT_662321 [Coprinopsis marcescibilis]
MLSNWTKTSWPILYVLVAALMSQLASASPIAQPQRNLQARQPIVPREHNHLHRRQTRLLVASVDGGPVDLNIVDLVDLVHISEVDLQAQTLGTPEYEATLATLEDLQAELANLMRGVATFVEPAAAPQSSAGAITETVTATPVPSITQTELPATESTGIPIFTVSDEPNSVPTIVQIPNDPPAETQRPQVELPSAPVTFATRTVPRSTPTPAASGIVIIGGVPQGLPGGNGGIIPQQDLPRSVVTLRVPTPTGLSENSRGGSASGASCLSPPMRLSAVLAGISAIMFAFVS